MSLDLVPKLSTAPDMYRKYSDFRPMLCSKVRVRYCLCGLRESPRSSEDGGESEMVTNCLKCLVGERAPSLPNATSATTFGAVRWHSPFLGGRATHKHLESDGCQRVQAQFTPNGMIGDSSRKPNEGFQPLFAHCAGPARRCYPNKLSAS